MPQLILIISGAVLIGLGVVLIVVQMIIQVFRPNTPFPERSLNVAGPFSASAALRTTYPGLVMIVLGIVLEVVGYLATAPWR